MLRECTMEKKIDESHGKISLGLFCRMFCEMVSTELTLVLMRIVVTMHFHQAHYYKPSKIIMSSTGQWPYQSVRTQRSIRALVIVLFTCQVGPQIMGIIKCRHEPELLIECFSPLMFDGVIVAKMINCVVHSKQLLKLLEQMRKDWQIWSEDQEVKILHKYAENGRKLTLMYAVSIYSTAFLFETQPLIPKVIDTLFKNGTEPGAFPLPMSYELIDQQKYYGYLISFSYVCVAMITFSMIAADLLFIVFVVHCCGIFAAVGHKLRRMGVSEKYEDTESLENGRDRDVEHVISCIDRHNDAIEFATVIEEIYRWCFIVVVGLNMIMLSVTGYQVVTKKNDPQATIRYIAFVVAQMVHLYVESLLAQFLTDHSTDIRNCLYDSEWYNISHKARKLLNVITMRCNIPCYLTAGKVCIMSVPTFGAVVKTSMSYFTILRSMD